MVMIGAGQGSILRRRALNLCIRSAEYCISKKNTTVVVGRKSVDNALSCVPTRPDSFHAWNCVLTELDIRLAIRGMSYSDILTAVSTRGDSFPPVFNGGNIKKIFCTYSSWTMSHF
jgi:hypothetical protein